MLLLTRTVLMFKIEGWKVSKTALPKWTDLGICSSSVLKREKEKITFPQ